MRTHDPALPPLLLSRWSKNRPRTVRWLGEYKLRNEANSTASATAMTSARQIEANRRNALASTGPRTENGKQRASQNAVRHGLMAETVILPLEDADDYQVFELAVTADYEAETAVERELVLRLASLLWRLRRATSIETGLLQIQHAPRRSRTQRKTPS
jgi:hypothetical protein